MSEIVPYQNAVVARGQALEGDVVDERNLTIEFVVRYGDNAIVLRQIILPMFNQRHSMVFDSPIIDERHNIVLRGVEFSAICEPLH